MHRLCWVALVLLPAGTAAADSTAIGGWFGPRLFSSSSRLGYLEDAPVHPVLQNGMQLGGRVSRPFLPWLHPELELAISPTSTNAVGGAKSASVFWFEPRLHLRFELQPERRLRPFVTVGGGAPVTLSSAKNRFGNSISADGYVGAGVRFDTHKGFTLRFDARLAILPSHTDASSTLTSELELGIGIEILTGGSRRPTAEEARLAQGAPPADRDGDRMPDAQDGCPDRAEDVDGYEDSDGCPDIDNDLDRVLDIADKCAETPEPYNGYEDDDGCPDTVPDDVDALRGTIEGLIYADGETAVRGSAQPGLRKIARTMAAHPSIRVVLIGHTDDREARQAGGEGAPADLESASADLARTRAQAVKNALVELGIAHPRILVESKGADDSVSDNATPRGRLANRRVEIKLYIPAR